MTRALFLSIKPRYARAILEGRKTIEVRRRFPDLPVGTTIVLYSSSPERAIVGTVRLKRAMKLPPDRVWGLHSDAIDIPKEALGEYLKGADASTLLEVEHPRAWERPVSLASLRDLLGFGPPQSFRYLDSLQVELIARSGLAIAH